MTDDRSPADSRDDVATAELAAEPDRAYRALVGGLDRGFAVIELILDPRGRPVDARFVETNRAFEHHTGFRVEPGTSLRRLVPELETVWLETCGRVAATGTPARLVEHARSLGRWYEVDAYPFGEPGRQRVAILFSDITGKRRTEEALRRSEARFRQMADAVPQIVWSTDAEGRTEFLNKRWQDYTGRPYEQTTATAIAREHLHPDDVAPTIEAFDRARAGGGIFEVEHRIRAADGSYRWFLVRGEPQRDEHSGRILTWFGASTDIHDLKRAEAARSTSEGRLRLILERARDYAIFVSDPEGVIVDWWPGAEAVFGWEAEEIVGRSAVLLFTPEDREAGAFEHEREVARRDGSAPDVRWHVCRDGTRVFIQGSTVALRDDAGQLQGFLKIGQDVTERRKAERALRDSEARFREFGDASSDILWIRDAGSLAFEYLSPACTAILGTDCDTLLAANGAAAWEDLVHPQDREALRAHLAQIAAGGRRVHEYRILRQADGEPRWLQDTAFPLHDAGGRVRRIAGITADVSDEKDTRDRLKVLVSELQHRTRNLLAVVQALAERTISSSASLDDFRLRFYPRLDALARVNELLSRLEADERVTFDQLLRTELAAHGAIDEPGAPARISLDGPAGIRLRSSTIQTLALAMHELCTNSLKYGALTRPEGRLALSWRERRSPDGERRLLFSWEETGVPVAPTEPAKGRGFGRELIERALPRQLKTEVDYRLGPDGVRCTISLPLSTRPLDG